MTSSDNHAAPDDGGPAFPGLINGGYSAPLEAGGPGMSLRDHFAGQVLAEVFRLATSGKVGPTAGGWTNLEELIAAQAYAVADAMLAARKQGGA